MILVVLCFAGRVDCDKAFAQDNTESAEINAEDPPVEPPVDPVEVKNGWVEEDGAMYYYVDDVKVLDAWVDDNGARYRVDKDGK